MGVLLCFSRPQNLGHQSLQSECCGKLISTTSRNTTRRESHRPISLRSHSQSGAPPRHHPNGEKHICMCTAVHEPPAPARTSGYHRDLSLYYLALAAFCNLGASLHDPFLLASLMPDRPMTSLARCSALLTAKGLVSPRVRAAVASVCFYSQKKPLKPDPT